jgi:hypothetical protein
MKKLKKFDLPAGGTNHALPLDNRDPGTPNCTKNPTKGGNELWAH